MRNQYFCLAKGKIAFFWCLAFLLSLSAALVIHGASWASTTPQISAGADHTIALKSDGTVWAWGYNGVGQLGDGTLTDKATPVQVSSLSGITAIAGGAWFTIALKSDGTVWTWGENGNGQLGDGTLTDKATPVQVSNISGVTAIAGGVSHTIALKSDGTVWAWGYNSQGQLGDGTTTDRTTPVQVSGLSGVTAIACGGYHTIILKSDGSVWTWGYNSQGQLGDGTTTDRITPVQVSGLSGVTAIACGGSHTIALKYDGTVWTWGNNVVGQLGDKTTTYRTTPVQVSGLSGVTAIANVCGGVHTVALKSDGTVWAWGYNSHGQLGDGTTTDRTEPVQVSSLSVVTAIAGGGTHTIALKYDGTVWACGENRFGQLGDGTFTNRTTPVQVSINLESSQPPTVTTGTATSVTSNSAALNGTVNANGLSTTAWFNYGITSDSYAGTTTTQSINGTSATSVSATISGLSSNTTYYYRMASQSDAGTSYGSETSFTTSAPSDSTIPSGSININSGATYTNSTSVTLTLSAQDNSGVVGYYTSTSNTTPSASASGWKDISSTTSYNGSISYTLSSGDGNKTVYVWYKDDAGNVSDTASDDIILDTTTPTITITSPTSDATYTTTSSTISLSGSASDSTSGVSSVTWSSGTASGTTSWSISNISLSSGDNVITITATDGAGNTNTDTITITYNTTTLITVTCEQENAFDSGDNCSWPYSQTKTRCCCWCPDPTGAHAYGHVMDLEETVSTVNVYFEIKPGAGDAGCATTGYMYYSLDGKSWTSFWSQQNLQGWTTYTNTVYVRDSFRYVRANTDGCSVDWSKIVISDGSQSGVTPTVTTGYATDVTSNSATLNGVVNPNGSSTTTWFQYGTTTGSYSNTSSTQNLGSGVSDESVSIGINGLLQNTQYYYRIVAQNSAGIAYGSETTFTTSTTSPTPIPSPSPTPSPTLSPCEAIIYGFVKDEDELPLKNVSVCLTGPSGYYECTKTDEDGFFVFEELASGDYTLEASKSGYQTHTEDLHLEPCEELEVVIYPPDPLCGSIYGFVVDIRGDPVENARLKLRGLRNVKHMRDRAVSDKDGFFEFSKCLDAGKYVITINKKRYRPTQKTVELEEGEEKDIGEIVLKRKSTKMKMLLEEEAE